MTMTRYLVDTHTYLWAVTGDRRLSDTARGILEDGTNDLRLSIASAWEIAIKARLGKLVLEVPVRDVVVTTPASLGLRVLSVSLEHVCEVSELPPIHRDPFDRMLIAQARVEGLRLLSRDQEIGRYEVQIVW